MAVNLAFFINKDSGQLSKSAAYLVPYTLPDLTAGDTVALKIGLVEDLATSGQGATVRLSVTGYTLKVAVGSFSGGTATVATNVTCTVGSDAEGTYFTGNLPMNVAGVTGLFASVSQVSQVVEFEVTDATGTISHKKSVTIYQELISSSLAAATAPDVSLGKAEALNTYVRLGENTPGAGPIFVSADGSVKMQLYLDNQGQLQLAPVT
jgi:hypothetical protein